MIETLSRKLTDQEIVFWKSHLDRNFIANTLFPAIGDHFRSSNNEVRLLDIGVQSYNRADKDLLNNNEIKFYGLDRSRHCDIPDDWVDMIYTDLSKPHCRGHKKFRQYFDAIIDYGVLGWPDVNQTLCNLDFTNYINNILHMLKDGGLYFFKNDLMGNHEKVRSFVCRHFKIKPFYDIANVTVGKYETFVFQKKLRSFELDGRERLKDSERATRIASLKVIDGDPRFFYDKFKIFASPFFGTPPAKEGLRIDFPIRPTARLPEGDGALFLFKVHGMVLESDFHEWCSSGNWTYWVHPTLGSVLDHFSVDIYV